MTNYDIVSQIDNVVKLLIPLNGCSDCVARSKCDKHNVFISCTETIKYWLESEVEE